MSVFENVLSTIIVVAFLAAVIFYDYNASPVYYDCDNLSAYKSIPEEVMKECLKHFNKTHKGISISI